MPVVWSGLYFLALSLTQGVGWSPHLWAGAIVLSGLVGLGLRAGLDLLPATPDAPSEARVRAIPS